MVKFNELVTGFRKLDLDTTRPVIAHASLSAFGEVTGGADTLLGALLANFRSLVMPAFTYKTMLTPENGPPDNGLTYGSEKDRNLMSQFFRPDLPADRLMGIVPETLRRHPKARRSSHPILSFTGVNAGQALESQTLSEPLAPIRLLADMQGWVLLLGVDHTVNTSIHQAEKMAGRKQFTRWALTPRGVVECPGFPGCSEGFQAIAPSLEQSTRRVQIGRATIQAVPLADLIETARAWVAEDPLALLCERSYCERCCAVRKDVRVRA
jgi:aminoglycoside 3-N-acetyltransferase